MNEFLSPQYVIMLFHTSEVFIWGLSYQLGSIQRNLNELKNAGLICNEVSDLVKLGYEHNFGIAEDESLLNLAFGPFAHLLNQHRNPQAFSY